MSIDEDFTALENAYFGAEYEFIELTRVIPVDNRPDTFSPKLYSILGDACSQVENLLRLLCNKLEISYTDNEKNFPSYYKKLNETGILQRQVVYLSTSKQEYKPFMIQENLDSPVWWTAYNKTKHYLPQGYKKGNLGNTINALAGAYLLHCIYAYHTRYRNTILTNEWWNELSSTSSNIQPEFPPGYDSLDGPFLPKSKIFHCLSFFEDPNNRQTINFE